MTRYAKNTTVSRQKSVEEIERMLSRYGADQFIYGWEEDRSIIGFRYACRQIKFELPLPDKEQFRFTPARQIERHPDDVEKEWEKASRQRWRALCLIIKAKLEAIESGITTFESEFLAHTMLPGGVTVGEWAEDQIEKAIATGKMPKLLPAGT